MEGTSQGHSAIRKAEMKLLNSTRVRAPNSDHVEVRQLYDSVGLKPITGGSDDDVLSTPTLQDGTDQRKMKKKSEENCGSIGVVSCRNRVNIGTLNVRTIREHYKRVELAKLFLDSNIAVLGVQEHRIVHDEEIRIEKQAKGVHLVTTSAWRNSRQAATGGVGFMLTQRAYKAVSLMKSYQGRVFLISFDGNPRLTVITVYSPTEGSSEAEAEGFHECLRGAISDVPAHHLLMVVGDLNAHLSRVDVNDKGWYWHQTQNRNGGLLRDTMLEGNLEATNHRFQKRPNKLWTHLSDGTLCKSQIDYVLVRKKWRNSVKDTVVSNSFHSLGADHRVVISAVKLSLRKCKKAPRVPRYDFDPLKQSTELQVRYSVEVKNRFDLLSNRELDEQSNPTAKYANLMDAVQTANQKLLRHIPRRRRSDPTRDARVSDCRKELFKAKDNYHTDPSESTGERVRECKEALAESYRLVEEETLSFKISQAENAADRCKNKESWALINDITGRKSKPCSLVEGGSAKGRLRNWKAHFVKLLGQPPSVPDQELEIPAIHPMQSISVEEFTRDELVEAKKTIKEGKAYGNDNIAPEVLKRVDMDEIILDFCNRALTDGSIPDQWRQLNIVPVPKKGNLTKVDNYRGIALTSIVSKTLNRMILNRIRPAMEKILRINQNGFREGRSTTSHILCLRRILEGVRDKNLSALLLFIDFKKAFDSVHRGILMKILLAYGIPQPMVSLIEALYKDTMARVITEDGLTEAFLILAGVMQGDTLAPYLFVIAIDYVMTTALRDKDIGLTVHPRRSRRYPAVKVTDVDFADDLALTTDTAEEAQELLKSLELAANSIGLHLNEGKTKYIGINLSDEDCMIRAASGEELERVDDFVYLGSRIMRSEKDFEVRKGKAWGACHQLKTIWSSGMRRDMKIRLFRATVESVLLYGSETWTISQAMAKRINGSYSRMLRMALNIRWPNVISNADLFGSIPMPTVMIAKRRMRLAGHIARHDDILANSVLFWDPNQGHRRPGRPHLTYMDMLRKDTGLNCPEEIRTVMLDRGLWRGLISARTMKPT